MIKYIQTETGYFNALPGYSENNIQKQKPFYHTSTKNDLESFVFEETKLKESGFLEKLITDKTKSHKSSVLALLQEIELRENLNIHLLNNIADDISRQTIYMNNLANIKTQYSFELANSISKTKTKVENNILDLEKEKRKEYLECWRDLMFLKKYLLISLKDYWDLVKRQETLSV